MEGDQKMVKYLVFNPDEQVIGFHDANEMLEYVHERCTTSIQSYAKEDQVQEDEITASQVEDYATLIGATNGECRVYDMIDVMSCLDSTDLPRIYEAELMDFLNHRPVEMENDCPMMLYELLSQVVPIDLTRPLGTRYVRG